MNPETADMLAEKVERAHYLRGRFLHSFSQHEFLLLDIIKYSRDRTEYEELEIGFQRSLDGRIKTIRRIMEIPGPLVPFSNSLLTACFILEDNQGLRLNIAHGLLNLCFDKSGAILYQFRRFNPQRPDPETWEHGFTLFSGDQLEQTIEIACDAFDKSLSEIRSIYSNCEFEGKSDIGGFIPLLRNSPTP